jgi:hypothetical protein
MGFLRPEITSRQQRSPATPLGENVLAQLSQYFNSADFGKGVSAPNREAMGSVDSFIKARETPDQFMSLMGPLREVFQINTDRAAGEVREGFSQTGGRLSTALGREEGKARNEGNLNLEALMSQLFLGDQANLLNAIGQKQNMAVQNTAPVFDFGAAGVLPDQTIIQDSPAKMIFQGIGELLKAASASASAIRGGT